MLVEFYPSSNRCIQGCLHCPKSISQSSQVRVVSDVSDSQRELVHRVLLVPTQGRKMLNLSNNIGEYDFELFDDIKGLGLEVIGFNAGILGQDTQELMQSHLERFNQVLPKNSGDRNIQICGNLQYNIALATSFPGDVAQEFMKAFLHFLRNKKCHISDSLLGQVLISGNNVSERSFTLENLGDLTHQIFLAHQNVSDNYYSANTQSKFYPEHGLYLAHSKLVYPDDFNSDLNIRFMQAKRAKKQNLREVLEASKKGDFTITIFPDSVMVYHSSWNIHIPELFFTYDDFFEILSEVSKKNWFKRRRSLQELVDIRLQKRLI